MCGIAGYFSPERPVTTLERIATMTRALRHRGPDDEGCVAIDARGRRTRELGREPDAGLDTGTRVSFPHDFALGHTRFSIVDLSEAGHQPLWNRERSAVLVFNGEIYNQLELREELEKRSHAFRSNSDTEVLLAAYDEWGLDALEHLNGPWAFALYDLRRRRLVLSRDRVGKSPLYYAVVEGTLYFASEIKAIRAVCPASTREIDEDAVHDFVRWGWRDLDHGTFYRGIRSLDAASHAIIEGSTRVRPIRFWSLPRERRGSRTISFADAAAQLRHLLVDSVRLRLRADVGVAMELSGGLDSSSLVALRAACIGEDRFPVYCVRFEEPEADEEPFARAVASQYEERVDYRVIVAPRTEFWEHADAFVAHMDEPFHSPNLLTSQMLRRAIRADGFRVVIGGGGGDEVLAGYSEYRAALISDLLARGRLVGLARELGTGRDALRLLLASRRASRYDSRCAGLLRAGRGRCDAPARTLPGLLIANFEQWLLPKWLRQGNTSQYAIPIEPRSPFLDHRVAELAFSLPTDHLIHRGVTKAVLRKAMDRLLPEVVNRCPVKRGFPFPYQLWLAASKRVLLANLRGVEAPGLDLRPLPDLYDELAARDPTRLWRMASVALWHKRVHLGDPVEASVG